MPVIMIKGGERSFIYHDDDATRFSLYMLSIFLRTANADVVGADLALESVFCNRSQTPCIINGGAFALISHSMIASR
jgi:hypothetical protein